MSFIAEIGFYRPCAHCRVTVGTPKHEADAKNKLAA
jgi:hypothetical protein